MKRIAVIGDIHGCIDELKALYSILEWQSLDQICSVGDLVDRGPESGECVQLCIEKNILAVRGNHEDSILKLWDSYQKTGNISKNPYKALTLKQLTAEHIEFIRKMPMLHVFDENNLVLVHGGLYPNLSLYQQPHNICRAQMIMPYMPEYPTRWWGEMAVMHRSGKTEEENYAEGYRRWYEVYDLPYDCVYGHSVFVQPLVHQNPGAGRTIGIDTGNVFGGTLTAAIIGDRPLHFVSVAPKKIYCPDKLRKFAIR